MKRVVCDTGPVLHLLEVTALDLLRLPGEVLIPRAVDMELAALVTDWPDSRPAWLRVQSLYSTSEAEAMAWQASGLVHAGEAESLGLARAVKSDWYLTDDVAARVLATSLGVETHGTIGLLLWAVAQGHLGKAEAADLLDKLSESSLWVSPRVMADARKALDDLAK